MPWRSQHVDDFPSLGWEILDWCAEYLPSPRDAHSSLLFTDEQAMQIVEWFRLDPQTGRLVYRRGYSRRSKGWGKSPVEAAKAIAEFRGPVRFAGWDATGQPVGMPWGTKDAPRAWVQIGAISEDQTDNTWSVVHYLLTENDGKAADALGIDAGLTRCFLRNQPGAKMEPVTSAAGSREGQPITYGVIDESHLMVPSNGGVKLAKVIRRNVAKMGGRSYETTNAYVIGQESVAESSHDAVLAGSPGIFADEVEAPHHIEGREVCISSSDEDLLAALDVAYGKSWWVDRHRLLADIRDQSNVWEDSARFFLNWSGVDNPNGLIIPLSVWQSITDATSVAQEPFTFGVDTSPDRQWSSIAVAANRPGGGQHVEVAHHGPGVPWLVERLVAIHEKWPGSAIVVDPASPAWSIAAELAAAGIEVVKASAQTLAASCGAFVDAVASGALHYRPVDDHAMAMTAAVFAARKRSVGDGWAWSRKDSQSDITPLVAATLAFGALPAAAGQEHTSVAVGGLADFLED